MRAVLKEMSPEAADAAQACVPRKNIWNGASFIYYNQILLASSF
jgi:hypothetical protein